MLSSNRLTYFIWILSAQALAMQLNFDVFVPSEALHNYANQGALSSLRYKGTPITRGRKILVFGELEDRNLDGNGYYVDLKGAPWIGRPHGVVRCYMPRSEFNKLQSPDYAYTSLDPRFSKPAVAVLGTVFGLNEYGNFEVRQAILVPWATALLARPQKESSAPSTRAQTGSSQQTGRAPSLPSTRSIARPGCLPYAPERVNLAGRVLAKQFAGPPNYESVERDDRPEDAWLLSLKKPICTRGNEENASEDNVTELQLLFPVGRRAENYRQSLNRNVVVGGWLFHASTGHHHTVVILQVGDITAQDLPSSK